MCYHRTTVLNCILFCSFCYLLLPDSEYCEVIFNCKSYLLFLLIHSYSYIEESIEFVNIISYLLQKDMQKYIAPGVEVESNESIDGGDNRQGELRYLKVQLPAKLAPVISLSKYGYMTICGQWCNANPASLCTYLWIQPFNINSIIQSHIISPILSLHSSFNFSPILVTLNSCEGQKKIFIAIPASMFSSFVYWDLPLQKLYQKTEP